MAGVKVHYEDNNMINGARQGVLKGFRRLFARAMANDLKVFVIPGEDILRANGLDARAAGLSLVARPRHASVLLIVGELPPTMREAASVIFAQMMRPRVLFTLGVSDKITPLPPANIAVGLSQQELQRGTQELRIVFEKHAFRNEIEAYDAPALQVRMEYVCPMHPEVVQDNPGSCPKCGMFLAPREAQAKTIEIKSTSSPHEHPKVTEPNSTHQEHQHLSKQTQSEYFCPMHEEVVQDTPGDCPKCGMHLDKREKPSGDTHQKHQHMPEQTSSEYFCPMHEEVVQDNPGDCPKCGMHLDKRDKPSGATHQKHQHMPEQILSEYFCPMHEEVVQDNPGDCPKCGMHLDKRDKPSGTAHQKHQHMPEQISSEYFCPMHEEVVQDTPGDCPKCGMHLDKREKPSGDTHQKHQHMPEQISSEYFCPMHEEVVQDTPGDCPKCGMHLDKRIKNSSANNAPAPTDHNNMDHDTMNHNDSGFMSMIDVTKDLPRSSDGLQMEWIDVPYGPFSTGLPSGLLLSFSLDGDTVAGSTSHTTTENIPLLEHSPMHGGCFVKHFLGLDPLTPVSSQLLICRAMENAAGKTIDPNIRRAHIGALERERVASHLNWLTLFAQQTGFFWLAQQAGPLQLTVQRAGVKEINALNPAFHTLIKRIQQTPLLKQRTSGIGVLDFDENLSGVVARAAGSNNDIRSEDEIYTSLGFKTLRREESDAWARLQIRLDEIIQSLSLIKSVGEIALPTMIDLDDVTGTGKANIASPRGSISLEVTLEKGFVTDAMLTTPSTYHLSLIEKITDQQELGDALLAVGSLDISPWEIRQ